MALKPKRKTRRRRRKTARGVAGFVTIEIVGISDVIPDSCHLKKAHWVCWVNPTKTTRKFAIRFDTNPPPLRDASGKSLPDNKRIIVESGRPTPWFRLKTRVKKGKHFSYSVSEVKSRVGPAPGPEIIADD